MKIVKICKIHGELTEKDVHVEKRNDLKYGFYYRCAKCRRDKDRKYKLNNPDKHKASSTRARNEARRLYREGLTDVKPKADVWAENDRKNNPEKYRKWSKISRERLGQLRNTKEVCRKFKIKVDEYYRMLAEQNNKCAICDMEEKRKSRTDGKICALAIDHCHRSGIIRKLLCHDCNIGIGKFKDNVDLLKKAITYLEKHEHVGVKE